MTDLEKKTYDKVCEIMDRNKQIEEMAKVIENGINICAKKPCEDCDFCGADDCMCQNLVIAKELHTAGYRKVSEVVRKIFAEVTNAWANSWTESEFLEMLKELKKKYTEGAE